MRPTVRLLSGAAPLAVTAARPVARPRWAALAMPLVLLTACESSTEQSARFAQQAQLLYDSQDYVNAKRAVDAALRARDDNPQVYILKGRIEFALGDKMSAFKAYTSAVELDATNPEALAAVTQLGLQTGHVQQAETAAEKILQLNPSQTDALLVKGLIAQIERKNDDALDYAEKILAIDPNHEGGIILKSRTMALKGAHLEATKLMEGMVARTGLGEAAALTLLELYRRENDAVGMGKMFTRLIEIAPTNALRLDYANYLYKTGQPDAARQQVAAVVMADNLLEADLDDALALLRIMDSKPFIPAQLATLAGANKPLVRTKLANFYIDSGEPQLAADLTRSLADDGTYDARGTFALAQHRLGQTEDAASRAQLVLKKDPTNGPALRVMVEQAQAKGDVEAAITNARIYADEYPRSEAGPFALAKAYQSRKDMVLAQRAYEDGIKALPQSLPMFRAYTDFLLANGDERRARSVTRLLTRNAPALVGGWQLYADTCAKLNNPTCQAEAQAGMARAKVRYAIDLAPGEKPLGGLFGRLEQ